MPPPDENTAVDPTGAAWVVWLVIVGPGLLFATLTCVRRVAPGELVLVVRQGEVVRVRRNGFVARWPGLERFEPVTTDPRVVPLVIRSRTSDGVDVVALADLTVQVRDVEPGTAYVPPAQAARLAEDTVARAVEQLEVESLVDDLEALETRWPGQRHPAAAGRHRGHRAGGHRGRGPPDRGRRMSDTPYLLEVAVSVALVASAIGFAVGLAIGRGRQPRWQEKGSFVHKVSIGFATLDRLDAVLLRFEVEPASRLSGVEVGELRLPPGSGVAILARGKEVLVPDARTGLRSGDQVLVVAALGQVAQVEDRLRSVSRYGRLASWAEDTDAPARSARAFGVPRRVA